MRRVDAPLILTWIYLEVSNQSVGFCSMFLLSRRVCVRWWIIWWGGNVSLVRMLVFRLTESLWTLDNHVSVSARKANSRADRRHKFTRMSTPHARKGILCAAASSSTATALEMPKLLADAQLLHLIASSVVASSCLFISRYLVINVFSMRLTRETVIIMTWSSDLLFISDLIVDHYNLILASSVTFHFRTSHIDSVRLRLVLHHWGAGIS